MKSYLLNDPMRLATSSVLFIDSPESSSPFLDLPFTADSTTLSMPFSNAFSVCSSTFRVAVFSTLPFIFFNMDWALASMDRQASILIQVIDTINGFDIGIFI
ncbi:hypothetical protein [Sphingobacterium cellulitidis]|uniref:hypothetical protein n=1 Tax=Sphingobacterium cellulitidis TaxID=1768011 RepID=UPI00146F5971